MKKYGRDSIVVLFFFFTTLCIYFFTYHGNYWLSGWDNLQSDFDLLLNLKRAFYGAWQEYQGLGLPSGNAHVTEVVRIILLLPFSFLPQFLLRKLFFAATLLIGPLGVYFFIKNYVLGNKYNLNISTLSAFCGALFYLFNLATIQIFYTPFEPFSSFYALLPWLLILLKKTFQTPSRSHLILFVIINFIGSISFFIPTVFIVYLAIVVTILIFEKKNETIQKQYWDKFILLILIVMANSYWLFTFIYYLFNNISSQNGAYLNLMYGNDIYEKSVQYANIIDTLLLKGFLLDMVGNTNGKASYIMQFWREYLDNTAVFATSLILSLPLLLGIVMAFKKRIFIAFLLLLILFFSLLCFDTFPFSIINSIVRSNSLFNQIFRNPYTKFANVLLFCYSIFLAYGVASISEYIAKEIHHKKAYLTAALAVIILILSVYSYPLYKGEFLYSQLRVAIPHEYFDVFSFFKDKGAIRIANFPQSTPSGWLTYSWGYTGSGFLWYGIEQPILDRAFDVWHRSNENYYWEMSHALYSANQSEFMNLLNKYAIDYLLFDTSVTNQGSEKILTNIIQDEPSIEKVASFGSLHIYHYSHLKAKNYIESTQQLNSVLPQTIANDYDKAYSEYGTYKSPTTVSTSPIIYYPFRSLFTNRFSAEKEFSIQETDKTFVFKPNKQPILISLQLVLPPINPSEMTEINPDNLLETTVKPPLISMGDLQIELDTSASVASEFVIPHELSTAPLEVIIPKNTGYSSFTSKTIDFATMTPQTCDIFNDGIKSHEISSDHITLRSIHSGNCLTIDLDQLLQNKAYLLSIATSHTTGRPLQLSLYNPSSKREELTTLLPTQDQETKSFFIIPPKAIDGLGYKLILDNSSFNHLHTINTIGEIAIYPIPYSFLTSIKLETKAPIKSLPDSLSTTTTHPYPFMYKVTIDARTQFINLQQSFDTGWIAYRENTANPLLTNPLKQEIVNSHTMINNWANGWEIDNSKIKDQNSKLIIVYWPQYLIYLGFFLLFITIAFILLYGIERKKTKK